MIPNKVNQKLLNKVVNRFLPIPESVLKNLEPEPKITDFTLIKELGVGSFGRVLLVRHNKTQAEFAIKAIDKRNSTNIQERPYFRRELESNYSDISRIILTVILLWNIFPEEIFMLMFLKME